MRESERERGRGRKREDILRGRTVIYEQATSNKQGEGDTPSPIKPGEPEEGEKSVRELKRELQSKRGKIRGTFVPDELVWI